MLNCVDPQNWAFNRVGNFYQRDEKQNKEKHLHTSPCRCFSLWTIPLLLFALPPLIAYVDNKRDSSDHEVSPFKWSHTHSSNPTEECYARNHQQIPTIIDEIVTISVTCGIFTLYTIVHNYGTESNPSKNTHSIPCDV